MLVTNSSNRANQTSIGVERALTKKKVRKLSGGRRQRLLGRSQPGGGGGRRHRGRGEVRRAAGGVRRASAGDVVLVHCDPKPARGRRLAKQGLINSLLVRMSCKGAVLTPAGERSVSRGDAELVARAGLGVKDRSWAGLDEVSLAKLRRGRKRLLPFLLAANPVKYGKPLKLTCGETMAGALWIVGMQRDARALLGKFTCQVWRQLFDLSKWLLDAFTSCDDSAAVVRVAE
jgi:pre-rRNA-processing protein TSR3